MENDRFGIDSSVENARLRRTATIGSFWGEQRLCLYTLRQGHILDSMQLRNRFEAPTDAIQVPSCLTLDLGDSTFVMEPTATLNTVFSHRNKRRDDTGLYDTRDTDSHIFAYSQFSPSHEFALALCIATAMC